MASCNSSELSPELVFTVDAALSVLYVSLAGRYSSDLSVLYVSLGGR